MPQVDAVEEPDRDDGGPVGSRQRLDAANELHGDRGYRTPRVPPWAFSAVRPRTSSNASDQPGYASVAYSSEVECEALAPVTKTRLPLGLTATPAPLSSPPAGPS